MRPLGDSITASFINFSPSFLKGVDPAPRLNSNPSGQQAAYVSLETFLSALCYHYYSAQIHIYTPTRPGNKYEFIKSSISKTHLIKEYRFNTSPV